MLTDSNTALSLSSGVLPKTSKSSVTSQEGGAVFKDDFNKAKAEINPQSARKSDDSVESSKDLAHMSNVASSAVGADKENASSDSGVELTSDGLSEGEEKETSITSLVAESGKALQSDGGVVPAELNDLSLSEDGNILAEPILLALSESELQGLKSDPNLPEEDSQANVSESYLMPAQLSDSNFSDLEFQETNSLELADSVNAILQKNNSSGILSDTVKTSDGIDSRVVESLLLDESSEVVASPLLDESAEVVASPLLDESAEVVASPLLDESAEVVASPLLDESAEVVASPLLDENAEVVASPLLGNYSGLSNAAQEEGGFDVAGLSSSEESQLSWVLSQMEGANKAPVIPVNSNLSHSINMIDSVKGGASIGNAGRRAETTPLSLSLGESIASVIDADTADSMLLNDSILTNEPIELRKKEHEAMISRMSAQIDGKVAGSDTTGGLNGLLQNHTATRAASTIGATVVNAPQANLAMNLPPHHPGWAGEMSQKVAWVARDGGHTAHIRLDPPELGSLTVKISVDNDSNTQVNFVAATPQARDLLESQMGRLRDMLAQQGMDLSKADVDVSQQDTSGMQRDAEQGNHSDRRGVASQDENGEDLILNNMSYVSATGVDYYA